MAEEGQPTGQRRVTVTEAAWILDTTVDALRKRVQRDTIPYERDEYGGVWILVDADRTRQDKTGQRPDTGQPQPESSALISELRAHNATLREQLEAERQAHAEARRLLLSALEKIPPAIEPPGAPSEATEQPGRVVPQPAVESTQEPLESSEMHMPEAGGGPLPHDQQRPSERRWWEFWR
jgi:hypothetical protein